MQKRCYKSINFTHLVKKTPRAVGTNAQEGSRRYQKHYSEGTDIDGCMERRTRQFLSSTHEAILSWQCVSLLQAALISMYFSVHLAEPTFTYQS
jgi:hypothetical protein